MSAADRVPRPRGGDEARRELLGDALARLPLAPAELDALAVRLSPAAARLLRRADRSARLLRDTLRDTLAVPVPDEPRLAFDGFAARTAEAVGRGAERRLATALDTLRRPVPVPAAARDRRVLDRVFADAAEVVAERLRGSAAGDLIAAGLAPSVAPRDVDWASAALEELERQRLGFTPAARADLAGDARAWSFGSLAGAPTRTPGWLWARIRDDVRLRLLAMRRRRALRTAAASAAAAVLLASGLWWWGAAAQPTPGAAPAIVFQSVSAPLTDQFSTTALVRRLRDGR